jgi:membrane protein implicated in regulation of membrane protease activity
MAWWLWVLVGFGLLLVETITPGSLFALFFGVGALCVAPIAASGIRPTAQWLSFTLLSLLLLGTLRGRLQERLRRTPPAPVDPPVGEDVVLLEAPRPSPAVPPPRLP